jgi:hypothetical protein
MTVSCWPMSIHRLKEMHGPRVVAHWLYHQARALTLEADRQAMAEQKRKAQRVNSLLCCDHCRAWTAFGRYALRLKVFFRRKVRGRYPAEVGFFVSSLFNQMLPNLPDAAEHKA